MEKAQQRLAALERKKEVLQGTTPRAAQAASGAAPNKLVEKSLRNELQSQVCITLSSCCDNSLHLPGHLEELLFMRRRQLFTGCRDLAAKCRDAVSTLAPIPCHLYI